MPFEKERNLTGTTKMFSFKAIVWLITLIVFATKESTTEERKQEKQIDKAPPSSFANLQVPREVFILCGLNYNSAWITVYEDSKNKRLSNDSKKYFYDPITFLDHRSAKSYWNTILDHAEMQFRIKMWNDEIENLVVSSISEKVGIKVKPRQVQVLPLGRVNLVNTATSPFFSLPNKWSSYNYEKDIWFTMNCKDIFKCREFEIEMNLNPKKFCGLVLKTSLKPLEINIFDNSSSSMFNFSLELSNTEAKLRKITKKCDGDFPFFPLYSSF